METESRCGICEQPIKPGDKATVRTVPDKAVVRVHNICYAKASVRGVNQRSRS